MTEFKSIKELEKEIECSKDLHNENCYDICSCENLEYIKNQTQAIIKLIEDKLNKVYETEEYKQNDFYVCGYAHALEELIKTLKGEK